MTSIDVSVALDPAPFVSLFDLPDMNARQFQRFLLDIPPEDGIRAVFLKPVVPGMQARAPQHVDTFLRFRQQFQSPPPLSYIPLRNLVLICGYASHLIAPRWMFRVALNKLLEAGIEQLVAVPLLQTVVRAYEQDVAQLLRSLARSQRIFFDHGDVTFRQYAAREVSLYFHGHHAFAMDLLVPGFIRGMLRLANVEGDVQFEFLSRNTCEVLIQWL